MQDFTGVPAIVDLAAMREAMIKLGGNPDEINPLSPAELVIDHSVQVDDYGTRDSLAKNTAIEFERNAERYAFLRWGQTAFRNFKVVPPNTGIVHQVNLEYLARVVFDMEKDGVRWAYPDTLVGTDSHTTMVNGLGVLGWGVGGIEAEAAMLGQPVTMLIPQVIGFKLIGQPAAPARRRPTSCSPSPRCCARKAWSTSSSSSSATASRTCRSPTARPSPTCRRSSAAPARIFPIDEETLRYLELTGPHRRADRAGEGVRAGTRACGARTASRRPTTPTCSSSTSARSSRRSPARSVRRTACRCARRSRRIRRLTRRWPKSARPRIRRRRGVAVAQLRRQDVRGRGRRGADRRDHELHQHVEPGRADRRRPARAQCAQARPDVEALGQDQPRAGLARRHRLSRQGRALPATSKRSASTSSATAARPASATPVRCKPEISEAVQRRRPHRLLGALRQSQLRRPRASGSEDELPRLAAAGRRVCARRHARPRPARPSRSAPAATASRSSSRTSGRRQGEIHEFIAQLGRLRDVQEELRQRVHGRRALERDPHAERQDLRVGRQVDLREEPAVLRRHDDEARRGRRHPQRARARAARRFGHDRPHLARRRHREDEPGREVPDVARRAADGLQLVRRAPRQSRSDDARHVREHPPAQPARAGHRRRRHGARAERRADEHLRRRDALQAGRHAARHARRQGIRHRLVARLGREGHDAARREGRDRRELRAHPPLEPDRHGRAAAAVQGRPERAVARPHRQGDVRDHRAERRRGEGRHGRRDAADRARRSSSKCACASTRRRSASTSSTAASCTTCCASWRRRAKRRDGGTP